MNELTTESDAKLLVACGCSYTYGYTVDGNLTPYPEMFSKKISYDLINLASPGASNYYIAKQIEHSITLNPSLVVIGVTTPLRFDILFETKSLKKVPSISDFTNDISDNSFVKIQSRSIPWLDYKIMEPDTGPHVTERLLKVRDYLVSNVNEYIKSDQDMLQIMAGCFLLEKNNIPYILVDFGDIFKKQSAIKALSFKFKDMVKKFPVKGDPTHFNLSGHSYVSEKLFKTWNEIKISSK